MAELEVPGARLYYARQGAGPLLLLIGSPMDSTGFEMLANALVPDYTVVTYDPRGLGNSTREDTDADITPELQADDVHRLIDALGGGPVDFFGSSGGATVGLALVEKHPEQVRTLVAHEPPVIELLPDREEQRAKVQEIYDTYRAEGAAKAMEKFMAFADLEGGPEAPADAPKWQPTEEQLARMDATNQVFYAHLLRQTTGYVPDIETLQASPTRIVVGAGVASKGQLPNRTAVALAERLGTPVVDFPGDHGGFMMADLFAPVLVRVLGETA